MGRTFCSKDYMEGVRQRMVAALGQKVDLKNRGMGALIGRQLSVNGGHVSGVLSGKALPSMQLVQSICINYNLDFEAIKNGKSAPAPSPASTETEKYRELYEKEKDHRRRLEVNVGAAIELLKGILIDDMIA